jgi:hypothetical protein
MASFKTVGFVINRAIELAQLDSSSSFQVLARQYYNILMDDVVTGYDWPYFRIQNPDTLFTNVKNYALPADYSRSDTCFLIDQNGAATRITIISKYRFDLMTGNPLNGDPRFAYIDTHSQEIVFNACPNTTRYWRLTYFRAPLEIDDQGGDDAEQIDFQDVNFVVNKLAAMLLDYTDDERAQVFHQRADQLEGKSKMSSYDEDNNSIVELGPQYRQGMRPPKGGSSGYNF